MRHVVSLWALLATAGSAWGQHPPPPPTPSNPAVAPPASTSAAKPATKSTAKTPSQATPGPLFQDIRQTAGIDFTHPHSPEKKYILESVSGGVALFDYNRDGRLDIYLVSSLTVATARQPELARGALYKNLGDRRFVDVAEEAGVALAGWGVGVCVADVDGDGFQDLFVTGVEGNHFYRNVAGKRFEDTTSAAGLQGGGWSTGCGFADYDRDGDLDLFVARYLDLDIDQLPEFGRGEICTYRDIPVQCGPRGLPGQSDLFYRNDGDGHFEEVGQAAGLGDPDAMFGLGVTWFDADGDGWPDLYVANDTKPNFLYINQQDGTFEEMSFPMGVAVSEDGKEQGSMGIAVGDYRNEGRPSLFVTNFSEEFNALYYNQGGYFTDASFRSATAAPSLSHVGWGTAFFDYDNDGWLDLLLVNGHVYPQIDQIDMEASAPYRQRRMLFHNRRDGTFEDVAPRYGGPLMAEQVSRGLAVGDLDDDGRLDVVINNLDGQPEILHNVYGAAGHWLQVQLEGQGKMRDGIGAVITVRSGKNAQTRTVHSGASYLSHHDLRQHFGLGERSKVDSVEVRWPDGSTSKHLDVAADQTLVVRQQAGDRAPE